MQWTAHKSPSSQFYLLYFWPWTRGMLQHPSYLRSLVLAQYKRVANFLLIGFGDTPIDEFVVDLFLDENTSSSAAALTSVEEHTKVCVCNRSVHCKRKVRSVDVTSSDCLSCMRFGTSPSVKVTVSSHIAQYPVLRTAQSALHFTALTDLFNQTPYLNFSGKRPAICYN